MILFVDASAMVAMMTLEADHIDIERRFGAAEVRLYSAISLWETIRAIAVKRKISMAVARAEVQSFVSDFGLRFVPIGEAEGFAAIEAHERFGKGSGHRAKLNMGDCFAYACARTNDTKLLYKGEDFVHTDLA